MVSPFPVFIFELAKADVQSFSKILFKHFPKFFLKNKMQSKSKGHPYPVKEDFSGLEPSDDEDEENDYLDLRWSELACNAVSDPAPQGALQVYLVKKQIRYHNYIFCDGGEN